MRGCLQGSSWAYIVLGGGGRVQGQKRGTEHSEEVMKTPAPSVLHLHFALGVFSAFPLDICCVCVLSRSVIV